MQGTVHLFQTSARNRRRQTAAIEANRRIIHGADPTIAEGMKGDVPSFRTTECFATTHLPTKAGMAMDLRLGARARNIAGMPIEVPRGLLQ